jgi:hypothetical protein
LNSCFPKRLAHIGAASQSYQLPPVADLLRQLSSFKFHPFLKLSTLDLRLSTQYHASRHHCP